MCLFKSWEKCQNCIFLLPDALMNRVQLGFVVQWAGCSPKDCERCKAPLLTGAYKTVGLYRIMSVALVQIDSGWE